MPKQHKNGKLKSGKILVNDLPANNPLSGVFDFSSGMGPSALSTPFEFAANNNYSLISLQRILLSYAYVLHGTLRTLVDQPIYDAFRGGIKIKTDEVSPEEIEDLHREIRRLKLWRTLSDALRWDRLYGGAGVIINTNSDYKTPLRLPSINESTIFDFIAVDRWELLWNGLPGNSKTTFNYYGKIIDPSRVAKIVGEEAPSIVRQRLQGWGMSTIECVIREVNQYFKNNNVIFELLDEAKIDIWKIKGFNSQVLSDVARGKTAKRIAIATQMKNYLNAITLDSEDDYQQKQMTFTGLANVLEQIRIGMAAAIRMPMSKIFGLASSGFSSGEDDIENYNAIVEKERYKAEDVFDIIVPMLCMKTWGFVPDDLAYEWRPLRVLTAEQEQNVLNSKYTRLSGLYSQGILNPVEYCEALKQEKILTMETEVSKGADPEPPMADMMGEEEPKVEEPKKKKSEGKSPKKEQD